MQNLTMTDQLASIDIDDLQLRTQAILIEFLI